MSNGRIDFICVGAEKCGTTWLAEMLRQHPQIFLPKQKELHYFNRKFDEDPSLHNYNFDKPASWYLSFFAFADQQQLKGEICPSYLWDEYAPRRIYEFEPRAKIFMILRDPVERTFSAYRFYIQKGLIPSARISKATLLRYADLILYRSAYFSQVKRYVELFPSDQVRVYFFDDLRRDPVSFLKQIERFLGIAEVIPQNVKDAVYMTGEPAFPGLNRFLVKARHWARRRLPTSLVDWAREIRLAEMLERLRQANRSHKRPSSKEMLDEETRQWLREYFYSDIERLENLLGVDLSAWKK